jgi:hypothetical protein
MRPNVQLQAICTRERLATRLTCMGFLTRMYAHVPAYAAGVGEHHPARLTCKGFLSCMSPHMPTQTANLRESLAARLTNTPPHLMGEYVSIQVAVV